MEKEIIFNRTEVRISFIDRLKFLFGHKLIIEVRIETDNPLNVIVITKSEAKARVINPNSE